MGDFFPGGWQLDFDLLKHGAGTYSKIQREAIGKYKDEGKPPLILSWALFF
jgi:hypothetical protein